MALIKVKAPYYYLPTPPLAKPKRSGFLIRPVSMLKKQQNVQIKKNHHQNFFFINKKIQVYINIILDIPHPWRCTVYYIMYMYNI